MLSTLSRLRPLALFLTLVWLPDSVVASCPLDRLEWLTGTWSSTQGGMMLEKTWTSPDGGSIFGISRTIAGERVRTWEVGRLECQGDRILYRVWPGGRENPTTYPIVTAESDPEGVLVFTTSEPTDLKRITMQLENRDTLVWRAQSDQNTPTLTWRFERRPPREAAVSP